jgi:hypothetical protein
MIRGRFRRHLLEVRVAGSHNTAKTSTADFDERVGASRTANQVEEPASCLGMHTSRHGFKDHPTPHFVGCGVEVQSMAVTPGPAGCLVKKSSAIHNALAQLYRGGPSISTSFAASSADRVRPARDFPPVAARRSETQ